MNGITELRPQLDRLQPRLLIGGVVVLAVCGAAALASGQQFLRSYLIGYLFWFCISLGSMAVLMMHHLAGGKWGFVIRRVLESAMRTLPFMALLMLPVLAGVSVLYVWARPGSEPPEFNSSYLNVPSFVVRTVIYFAVWITMSRLLNRWSLEQDSTGDPVWEKRLKTLSGPGLVVYGLTMTFASIDWVMSLEAPWYSTIYGAIFLVAQGLSALAFSIAVLRLASQHPPLAETVTPTHFHDLGNMMFAFLMLWAYVAFSQLLLIWSGNLPEETSWYARRLNDGWGWIAVSLVVLHFALPFLLLLSRRIKRAAQALWLVAIAVLVMRLVDLFWVVTPAFYRHGFHIHWLDFALPLGIGGVWLSIFVREFKSVPQLPLHDARFAEATGHA